MAYASLELSGAHRQYARLLLRPWCLLRTTLSQHRHKTGPEYESLARPRTATKVHIEKR